MRVQRVQKFINLTGITPVNINGIKVRFSGASMNNTAYSSFISGEWVHSLAALEVNTTINENQVYENPALIKYFPDIENKCVIYEIYMPYLNEKYAEIANVYHAIKTVAKKFIEKNNDYFNDTLLESIELYKNL
jgi:hypothetical protein